jgi:hypothetical protein
MDWSNLFGGQRVEAGAVDTTVSSGTLLTGGTANVKGSYVELIASTAFHASWMLVSFSRTVSSSAEFLLDIAVGAAASEQVIVNNLYASGLSSLYFNYMFPVSIPPGTRISARIQDGASGTGRVNVALIGNSLLPSASYGRLTTYGANTADSGGVSIDPGGTLNTKGAYSEIVASTTNRIRGLIIAIGAQGNNARTDALWLFDVAIGAAGSEQIIISDLPISCVAAGDAVSPGVFPIIPISIPEGTRVAVRAQCSIIDAADRLFDVILYGVD